MKQEFTMNDAQWAMMMEAMEQAANQRVMYASGGVPLFDDPQEIRNRAWKKLGEEMGFVWDSAEAGSSERTFLATPLSQQESVAHSWNPPFRYNGD